MKILIITQAVDSQDTVLGFFPTWIAEFAGRAEGIQVMCLRKGEYDLPKNVRVHSLRNKNIELRETSYEKREGKIKIVKNFFHLIVNLKHEYDVVFVHMNQEYVVLGGLFWKLWGKKVLFWRNHSHGDMMTRLAIAFSDTVFYTSTHSFTARFSKAHIMPAGIDTHVFKHNPEVVRQKNSLLMLGRIAPIKHIELSIDALALLKKQNIGVTLTIVGDVLPKDQGYMETLQDRAEIAGVADSVRFEKGVPFTQIPAVFQRHEIFLNFTPAGSFDKTVIEALACGSKVLVSNESMKHILPEESLATRNVEEISKKIQHLLTFDDKQSAEYGERAREIVKTQSLDVLMDKILTCIN